jgi:hypothetical protein
MLPYKENGQERSSEIESLTCRSAGDRSTTEL